MTLTGKVQLVEKDGDKQVVVQEGKPVKTETCTDTERKKIQEPDHGLRELGSSAPPPAAAADRPPSAPSRRPPARRSRARSRQPNCAACAAAAQSR